MLKCSTFLSSSVGNQNDTCSACSVDKVDEYIFEATDFGNLHLKNKRKKETTYRVMVYPNGKYIVGYIVGETTSCYE